jgi:hypothetical protein
MLLGSLGSDVGVELAPLLQVPLRTTTSWSRIIDSALGFCIRVFEKIKEGETGAAYALQDAEIF